MKVLYNPIILMTSGIEKLSTCAKSSCRILADVKVYLGQLLSNCYQKLLGSRKIEVVANAENRISRPDAPPSGICSREYVEKNIHSLDCNIP